eukprot:m.82085 g.82085  ORF g.82085 m.82085 type:complete len:435 (+) comp8251_c0_seq2:968-2272(+)
MGFKTIRQGETAAVWAADGTCEIVRGPRRMFLFRKRMRILPVVHATQNQYLEITHLDGHVENLRGPAAMVVSPLEHRSITCKAAISLTSHEALVAYRPAPIPDASESGKSGYTAKVDRTIIRGPCLHVPEPNEWVHEFVWHGTDPENKTRLVPKSRVFSVLPIIPDQFYYNVRDVRTADDVLITIKCMVFFELVNIERMLDSTNDPIADFVNSVCADVITYSASRTYEEFLEGTAQLSQLESYPQLVQRAERSGFTISKVVYRGYHASDSLQTMHDDAIRNRTELRLQSETQEKSQAIEDMKLACEAQRAGKKMELLEAEARHQQSLREMAHAQTIAQQKATDDLEIDVQRRRNQLVSEYLMTLSDAGFNVTTNSDLLKVALTHYRTADKTITIQSTNTAKDGVPPTVHVYQQDEDSTPPLGVDPVSQTRKSRV